LPFKQNYIGTPKSSGYPNVYKFGKLVVFFYVYSIVFASNYTCKYKMRLYISGDIKIIEAITILRFSSANNFDNSFSFSCIISKN